MPQFKKFIMTKDQSMSNKLIAHGFLLLSNIAGVYTFVNKTPDKFSFDESDVKKLHFTNKLHL